MRPTATSASRASSLFGANHCLYRDRVSPVKTEAEDCQFFSAESNSSCTAQRIIFHHL